MKLSNITLLSIISFVFLTSYAAPLPSHPSESVDLESRNLWAQAIQSVRNGYKSKTFHVPSYLGSIVKVKTSKGPHPGVITDDDGHGNAAVAQVSHHLPEKIFPHRAPSHDIVPSANLQKPGDKRTSYINTGAPTWHPANKLTLDGKNKGRASLKDTTRLVYNQSMSFQIHIKVDQDVTVSSEKRVSQCIQIQQIQAGQTITRRVMGSHCFRVLFTIYINMKEQEIVLMCCAEGGCKVHIIQDIIAERYIC